MSGTVRPDGILKEMSDLWVKLGRQGEGDASAGVLRACAMTLLVLAEEADDPQGIGETLAALMPEHPSRAVVIRLRPAGGRELAARVFAQCWMPFGQRRQICCEQIEITGSEAGLAELAAVVLPLAAPDLPVVLWCRSARLFLHGEFPALARVARKIIVDSAGYPRPGEMLAQAARLAAPDRFVADLSWTRLTRWRELVSQIFENRAWLARLPRVSEAVVRYCGDPAPAAARYMAAWLAAGLERAGARARVRLERGECAGARPLESLELAAGGETEMRASVSLLSGDCAEVRIDALASRTALPAPTEYELLREELAIPASDPVFEQALAGAARLALS